MVRPAFSDFVCIDNLVNVEGHSYYPLLLQAFPESLFVYNDRPVADWLKSRLRHKQGSYLLRMKNIYGFDEDKIKNIWLNHCFDHKKNVLESFSGSPSFLHLNISMNAGKVLNEFLSNEFKMITSQFSKSNKTISPLVSD